MRKIVSLLLVLALLVPAMIACNNDEKSNDTSADVSDTTAPVTEEKAHPILPEKTFDGKTFNILTAAEQWIGWYNSTVADAEGGDIVSQAVYDRNESVCKKYDVELNYIVFNGYSGALNDVGPALNDSISGDATYDMLAGLASYNTGHVLSNYLANLYDPEYDYLNLDEEWWYTNANKEIEVAGKLYMASNHFGVYGVSSLLVTFFNKTLQTDNNFEDLYELVYDGTWTIDKFIELADAAKKDVNNDNIIDQNDIFGVATTFDYFPSMKTGMGVRITEINDEGVRVFKEPDERMIDVNEKIYEMMNSDYYICGYDLPGDGWGHEKMLSLFANNQTFFVVHSVNSATYADLRDMDDYGIIPLPKYDEEQTDYITRFLPEMVAIPAYVNDAEFSAYMAEALAYESWKTVTPAYFEDALQDKLARDPDTQEMLEIILENVECDFVDIYFRSFSVPVQNFGKVQNYATWYAQNRFAAAKAIDTLVEAVSELGQE